MKIFEKIIYIFFLSSDNNIMIEIYIIIRFFNQNMILNIFNIF